ncbi:MAG: hypothetical protein NTY64_16135 [Deltaproteobacteria bacterium]|nr:hypothetical protein [Deltaproteobacteria bacterium]
MRIWTMKKRFVALIGFILLFLPALALSETLSSPTGDPTVPVIVFKSEQSMAEGIKFLNAGGSILNYGVFGQYVRAIPDSGTSCLIVKSKLGKKQVRILDGPHKGKIGWVPSEMVK